MASRPRIFEIMRTAFNLLLGFAASLLQLASALGYAPNLTYDLDNISMSNYPSAIELASWSRACNRSPHLQQTMGDGSAES